MMFLSNWLNGFGQTRDFPISSRHLAGREAVLMFNERTVLTADRTVEYMI